MVPLLFALLALILADERLRHVARAYAALFLLSFALSFGGHSIFGGIRGLLGSTVSYLLMLLIASLVYWMIILWMASKRAVFAAVIKEHRITIAVFAAGGVLLAFVPLFGVLRLVVPVYAGMRSALWFFITPSYSACACWLDWVCWYLSGCELARRGFVSLDSAFWL